MKAKVQQQRITRLTPVLLALALIFGTVLMPISAMAAPMAQMDMGSMQKSDQVHIVRYGETLSGIALSYGVPVYAVMQANNIEDPNSIYAGQRLLIPSGSGSMPGGEMGGSMAGDMSGGMHGDMGGKQDAKCKAYHTVKHGETALAIGMKYGVSTYSLAQANGLSDANAIYVGQTLCIPAGPPPVNPPTTEMPKSEKPKPMPPMEPMQSQPMPPMESMPAQPMPPMEPMPAQPMPPMEPMPAQPMPPMNGGCEVHRVQQGETLAEIAHYYNSSIYALMKGNGITDPNKIYAGQVLKINCEEMGGMAEPMPMPMPEQQPMQQQMPMDGQGMMPEQPMSGNMQPPQDQPMPMPMPEQQPMQQQMPMDGQGMMPEQPMSGNMQAPQSQPMQQQMPMGDQGMMPEQPMSGNMQPPQGQPMPMPMPEQQPMQQQMPMGGQAMMPEQPMSGYMEASHGQPMPMPEQMPMGGHDMMPAQPMMGAMEVSYGKPMPMPHKGMSLRPQETWRGSYYCTKDLSGDPVFVRDDYDVRFNWYGNSPGKDLPEDRFSVRWERNVYFDGGNYQFTATVDDGVRVYVGDKVVIDAWREQPTTTYTADVKPPAGVHTVVVEYYEESNMASVDVSWDKAMGHW